MTRADALERWRRIAAGDLRREQYDEIDLHAWIEEVAKAVIEADKPRGKPGRPNDLARVIGLTGQTGAPPEMVRKVRDWHSFDAPEYWEHFDGKRDAKDHAEVVRLYRRDFPKECEGLADEEVYEKAKGWTRRKATVEFARNSAREFGLDEWEYLSDEEVIKRVKRMLDEG